MLFHLCLTGLVFKAQPITAPRLSLDLNYTPVVFEFEEPKPVVKEKPVTEKKVVKKKPKPLPVIKKIPKPAPKKRPVVERPKTSWIKAADYKRNTPPRYPRLSRRLGEEGTVIVKATVDKEGRARQVSVKESSGHKRLDNQALEAVKKWEFSPASDEGKKIDYLVLIPIKFELRQ